MNKNLKLVINNVPKDENQKYFFEKKELKIILNLYAKMVSGYSPLVPTLGVMSVLGSFLLILIAFLIFKFTRKVQNA